MNGNSIYVIAAILVLFALRMWRTGSKERRVRIETMWIAPVIIAALIGYAVVKTSGEVTTSLVIVSIVALAIGLGVGWYRGRFTRLTVDPDTHTLKGQASPLGLIFLAVLIVARFSLRDFLSSHAEAWKISPTEIVDGSLMFVLGMIVGRRLEIYLRCLQLLARARAEHSNKEIVSEEAGDDARVGDHQSSTTP